VADGRIESGGVISKQSLYNCTRIVFCIPLLGLDPAFAASPYQESQVLDTIQWQAGSLIQEADGSDNHNFTWASDGNIYVNWGDGWGFGSGSAAKVGFGVTRISGTPPSLTYENVHGGYSAENPSQFPDPWTGWGHGMLGVNGRLYALLASVNDQTQTDLWYSEDLGGHWTKSSVNWKRSSGFTPNGFVQFGKDHASARDSYVYLCGKKENQPGAAYLARVPKSDSDMLDQSTYEYLTGQSGTNGSWSPDISEAWAFFNDPSTTGEFQDRLGPWITYHSGLDKYILMHSHHYGGDLGIFESDNPWGPWYTVDYYSGNFLGGGFGTTCPLNYQIVPKWCRGDTVWMIFSCHCRTGNKYHDNFSLVKGTLNRKQPVFITPSHASPAPSGLPVALYDMRGRLVGRWVTHQQRELKTARNSRSVGLYLLKPMGGGHVQPRKVLVK
jgi:hypothetical protein